MSTKIIISLVVLSLLLVGCSSIPDQEKESFCKENGMFFYTEFQGGFACGIDDITYARTHPIELKKEVC